MNLVKKAAKHHIGFISTRFAGTDGVSLETAKWAEVLERIGHECFYFSGLSDRPAGRSRVVPEAFYRHPTIDAINRIAFAGDWRITSQARAQHPEMASLYKDHFSIYVRPPHISRQVQELKDYFKKHLYAFARDFKLELLIVENALSIPINLPLGLAITEFIAETGYPAIAHHHDFQWERQRFMANCVSDYIAAAFPPNLPSIRHVVINSVANSQLASRTGISARMIPNVMDFDHPPAPLDVYALTARADLGVAPDEYFFLQPTRIIQRKGIEHAIELTRRLGLKAKLVISHAAGDEGTDYERRLNEFANLLDVTVNFESNLVQESRGLTSDGKKIYTLADIYPQADLVTYPSSIEGFGNAFLEAIYYRRPIILNNYTIYEVDIKPKGFCLIEFDGFINERTLESVRRWLAYPNEVLECVEQNYQLAKRYYSFAVLEHHLRLLLADCLGEMSTL
ncbi:MAG: glycosyltransferase family 4 protein [Chloroflexi bacterium]|nr:glycosyltransferase family 4 protein [Chloroflexota bacterium]